MPGLIGVAGLRGGQERVAARFGKAIERMVRYPNMAANVVSALEGNCLLGCVYRSSSDAPAHLAHEPVSTRVHRAWSGRRNAENPAFHRATDRVGPTAVFHGVLYNEGALRRQVGEAGPTDSVPVLIAALYSRYGVEFVDRLEGEFCAAVVDPDRQRVCFATDPIGNYPVYWRVDHEGGVFSSDLSALLRATPAATRLDLRAVADYLTIGAVLGDKTLVEGVQELDPGTLLLYDARQSIVTLRSYVRIETFFEGKATDKSEYLEAVEAEFTQAVNRAASASQPVGLSLSGGLDSRAILGAVGSAATRLRTYTLGVEGCADQMIAQQLAAIAGTRHVFFRLDSTYLRDFLPNMARMVSITDGLYLSHGLTEMLAIEFLGQTGIEVLLRGHGGELAKAHLAWPLHTDPHVYTLKSADELVPYLAGRANYITPNLPLSQILTPAAAAAAGTGASEGFALVLKDTTLAPSECCSYLYLRELNRRFTVPSLELFRTQVSVRLPFLDPSFLRALLAAPAEWRDTTEIHRRLTSGNAMLLKVRNSNTGAAADAGALTEFILDKVNTLLKRLDVRGYRHYHDFDGWMRKMLLQSVESELLAPTARVQGFVAKPVLEKLIRESRDGVADRSYLLQILLILELWQRENHIEAAA
ncbi:MAG: asparagine synthase-related protein [Vicinamibacterales bacterium]